MVTREVIFDSNVWIGYFNTADSLHQRAQTVFEQYASYEAILTEYVLLEIATVLKQTIGPVKTNTLLAALLNTKNVKLLPSSEFFAATLAAFLSTNDKHLSFVDTSLLVLRSDFTIITFDSKLRKALTKS